MRKIYEWIAKLPKPFKWLLVLAVGHLTIALTAFYNTSLVIALLWGYWHSESSIGYWMAMGISPFWSTCIAIGTGTIATLNWLWFANCAGRPLLKIICGSLINFFSKPAWPRPIEKFMSWLAKRIIPTLVKLRDADLDPPGKVKKHHYLSLPVISFVPDGGVFVAISYVLFFRLNQTLAFCLITAGNILKMLCWGYGFYLIKIYLGEGGLIIAAILAFLLAVALAIGKLLSSKTK